MSLSHGDLAGTIFPEISIDEYKPKAGEEREVIVVAFYADDLPPAEDLNTFIQRGFIDTMDVEVSPSTNEDGHYLVFVEMARNETFPNKFLALLEDITNLVGKTDWKISTYLSDGKSFSANDPTLFQYITLSPAEYVPKDKINMDKMEESIRDFFSASLVTHLTIDNNNVIITGNNSKIIAEVIDIGEYDDVIGRNFLSESAFNVGQVPYEAKVLNSILGNCQVLPIEEYICINKDDRMMLLKDTQIKYGV